MTDDFVLDNTKLIWRTKEYKPYIETLLLDMEKARLPDTQQYATAVVTARNLKKQLQIELTRIISALCDDKTTRAERGVLVAQRNQLKVTISNANQAEIRNIHRPEDLGLPQGPRNVKVKRPMVKACPADTCRGFLSEDFSCPLCETKVCKGCHEILRADDHTCNPDTVESVKAVAAQSRLCPSCASVISKIDGCDQMWCTQCQTTFSWRTGLKEEGLIHNPHYYEFMRRNGGAVPRAPGDLPAGAQPQVQCGMPNLQDLIRRFSPSVNGRYQALITGWRNYHDYRYNVVRGLPWPPHWRAANHDNALISPWEMPVDLKKPLDSELQYIVALTSYHRNAIHLDSVSRGFHLTPPENHTLRVQFMLGEISEDSLKATIQRRDKAYRKHLAKRQIYDMAYQTISDIFREFVNSSGTTIEDFHKPYSHILEIMTYANLCFSKLEKAYTCTIEPYITNPFLTSRWM